MPRSGGVPAAGWSPLVRLPGNGHPAADKSIGWLDRLPNLGDPDALAVDMTTLTEGAIREMGGTKLDRASNYIEDTFLGGGGGGTIVMMTAAELSVPPRGPSPGRQAAPPPGGASSRPPALSNCRVLPVALDTVPVADGRKILCVELHSHKEHVGAVGHFEFYIAGCNRTIHSSLHGRQFFLDRVDLQDTWDNSGHDLGFKLAAAAVRDDKSLVWIEGTGYLAFLPPYTEPAADAIGTPLALFGSGAPHETPSPSNRPVPGRAAGPTPASAGRPGAQAAPRKQVAGPTAAENGPLADWPPSPYAEGAGQEGGAGTAGAAPGGAAAGGGGTDAFLSYHHEAKDGVARPLVEGLEKRGVTVWWDSTAMKISDTLSDKIREGLTGARCGVVIVSKGYLDSGWGQTELGAMFGKGMAIFPVLHGVTDEEAQKKLPVLSGRLMRPWNDPPEPLINEIARKIKKRCGPRTVALDTVPPHRIRHSAPAAPAARPTRFDCRTKCAVTARAC